MLANFFKRDFTQGGGKIVADIKFKSGDRDFTPQLSSIKAAKPDLIYAPIYYTECALVAKQAREMGIDVPILAGDGAQAPELIQLGGKAVEDVYFTAHFHKNMISTERGKKFLAQYKKKRGKSWTRLALWEQTHISYFSTLSRGPDLRIRKRFEMH